MTQEELNKRYENRKRGKRLRMLEKIADKYSKDYY